MHLHCRKTFGKCKSFSQQFAAQWAGQDNTPVVPLDTKLTKIKQNINKNIGESKLSKHQQKCSSRKPCSVQTAVCSSVGRSLLGTLRSDKHLPGRAEPICPEFRISSPAIRPPRTAPLQASLPSFSTPMCGSNM